MDWVLWLAVGLSGVLGFSALVWFVLGRWQKASLDEFHTAYRNYIDISDRYHEKYHSEEQDDD